MPGANLKVKIIGAIVCVMVFFMTNQPLLAATPHENPATAEPVYDGISLFNYYSSTLDLVLQKHPQEVESGLEKMPYANVPQSLKEANDSFAMASENVSNLVVKLDEECANLQILTGQFRSEEADKLASEISSNVRAGNDELDIITHSVEVSGAGFKVSSAPSTSDLRRSYDEAMTKIGEIRDMLALYRNLSQNLMSAFENISEPLTTTTITLTVRPTAAFVGDNVSFEGMLTSPGRNLAGRTIDILLNSSRYVTAQADDNGHYQGTLPVPYSYVPELNLQALYYPQNDDRTVYLASLSPVIRLKVLYYECELNLTTEEIAYPGRVTQITGKFDYGQSPSPTGRKVETYLDSTFISSISEQDTFTQQINIPSKIDVGVHVVTVSAGGSGRYAPVVASATLNVGWANPTLDVNIPAITMIPGSLAIHGKLYSPPGPLSQATIKMGLAGSQTEIVSSETGDFDARIKIGMNWGLIGSQELRMEVLPTEPWNAPTILTRSVWLVNVVNCGGIIIILALLAVYLPGQLRKRRGTYPGKRSGSPVAPEPVTADSDSMMLPASATNDEGLSDQPRSMIFYLYRGVLKLIQQFTRVWLKPQQTLREFADENSRALGPVAKYFIDLTATVERLLYSQYTPDETDVKKSRELSRNVEERLKGEDI